MGGGRFEHREHPHNEQCLYLIFLSVRLQRLFQRVRIERRVGRVVSEFLSWLRLEVVQGGGPVVRQWVDDFGALQEEGEVDLREEDLRLWILTEDAGTRKTSLKDETGRQLQVCGQFFCEEANVTGRREVAPLG